MHFIFPILWSHSFTRESNPDLMSTYYINLAMSKIGHCSKDPTVNYLRTEILIVFFSFFSPLSRSPQAPIMLHLTWFQDGWVNELVYHSHRYTLERQEKLAQPCFWKTANNAIRPVSFREENECCRQNM